MIYAAATIATGKVISTAPVAAAVTASLRLAYLIIYPFIIYPSYSTPYICGRQPTGLRIPYHRVALHHLLFRVGALCKFLSEYYTH